MEILNTNQVKELTRTEEELDRMIAEDIGMEAPVLPDYQQDFMFSLTDGPNQTGYSGWIQQEGINNYSVHVCQFGYLHRNLKQLEKKGIQYKVYHENVTKKEAYDWKENAQLKLQKRFLSNKDITDRERGNIFKD